MCLFVTQRAGTDDLSAAQHYLTHLFREKLVESKSHVVVVSSGAIRRVSDPCTISPIILFYAPLMPGTKILC